MTGLLIAGELVEVPGVQIINALDAPWAHLDPGDGRARDRRPSQIFLHKTKGDLPEKVLPGAGPMGRAERVAEFWQGDPRHAGAAIVVGSDGTAACLCDLVTFEAYHATVSNPFSIGIEIYEEPGGVVYEAAIDSAVAIVLRIAETCGIQLQIPCAPFSRPLLRFTDGGRDMVGVFGHRDNTSDRSRWDPGDAVFAALAAAGAESYRFDELDDLATWKGRQRDLAFRGHDIAVDGIPGPQTVAALAAEGFRGGVWALGKV